MGVPKFFRWLSERYPKINQRYGRLANPETAREFFPLEEKEDVDGDVNGGSGENAGSGGSSDSNTSNNFQLPPPPFEEPDPLSTCGLAPEIDRLYIDMNGVIHGCSHNNNDDGDDDEDQAHLSRDTLADEMTIERPGDSRKRNNNKKKGRNKNGKKSSFSNRPTQDEIFRNVCYYLDRIVSDLVQPKQLVYLAVDGVAPRAKLNQQRARRYRTGNSVEGEIEFSIYEAHEKAVETAAATAKLQDMDDDEDDVESYGRKQRHNNDEFSFVLDYKEGNSLPSDHIMDSEKTMSYTTGSSSRGGRASGSKSNSNPESSKVPEGVQEISPGRFTGKIETHLSQESDSDSDDDEHLVENNVKNDGDPGSSSSTTTVAAAAAAETKAPKKFHSNEITPGTPFFAEFTKHLEHFVKYKLSTDPKWKDLTIIFSGSNVPGEGEHKIMQFIREQREDTENYDPNLRHCIMGQDGDLIMLGLATHEPNLVLLRERVLFNMSKEKLMRAAAGNSLDGYIHNAHFEFLHLGVLRDYLAYEFETSNVLSTSPWDLEHTIDDFVFMTFFVGNDFLPHLPAIDIGDNAFDLLFHTYKQCRKKWLKQKGTIPYLTHEGNIVSGRRLEQFLSAVGRHEVAYYDKKKNRAEKEHRNLRKQYKNFGMKGVLPDESLVASKEASDRLAYRKMLEVVGESVAGDGSTNDSEDESNGFQPVLTSDVEFEPIEEELEDGLISRMSSLLQNSLSIGSNQDGGDDASNKNQLASIDDQDLKGRYYFDKFQMTPFDEEKHLALRKAYVEGLVWNLKYYYEGCVSWEWFYPYHYGPMLSDLVNLDEMLEQVNFDEKLGAPLRPFEQLLGCMPPSQASHLPKPYRWLMTSPDSPIIDFYPKSFIVDMNGKRWPWEAVVMLPFIDSKRLLEAVAAVDETLLTDEQRRRNSKGEAVVLQHDTDTMESLPGIGKLKCFQGIDTCAVKETSFDSSEWAYKKDKPAVLKPIVSPDTTYPLPGFSTLRIAPVQSLRRKKLGVNVFGSKSRYRTSCLELANVMPPLPPVEMVAPKLIGTTVVLNYPYCLEGLVTAVSNEKVTIRGQQEPREWTREEATFWKAQRDGFTQKSMTGEGLTGTGGVMIPNDDAFTLSVRPLEGIVETKDGKLAKTFAKFEVEVPLVSTFWTPAQIDGRLEGIPARLEKNAYNIAKRAKEQAMKKSGMGKDGTKSKRRKLFPPKPKRGSSLGGGGGGGRRISASSYSTLSFLNNQLRQKFSTLTVPYDGLDSLRIAKAQNVYLKSGDTLKPFFFSQLAKTPTWHSSMKREHGGVQSHHMNRRNHMAATFSIRRSGRLLAAGMVLAASSWLLNSTSFASAAIEKIYMPHLRQVRPSGLSEVDMDPIDSFTMFLPNEIFDYGMQESSGCEERVSVFPRGGDWVEGTSSSSVPPLEFEHGTTTLSFTFRGGIIAAVDSRASLGSFVGSKTVDKVLPINSHMLGTMAGGAADCQHCIRLLKAQALFHELTESHDVDSSPENLDSITDPIVRRGRRMSVARASRILSDILYANRGADLSVGTMIMGYDDSPFVDGSEATPHIYYIDNTGLRIAGDLFAVGSGATFALGILDTEAARDYRLNEMTKEEAIALGIKAIRHATFRDAFSGGFINVYLITPNNGWQRVYQQDIARSPDAWQSFREQENGSA
mmetsp:Transcript_22888/g.54264  ORF Transcript_22888/g.54264 Transcript_22888/m.54264 type:complete len:1663 (-) Transcript_22888:85-5073(-)